MPTTMLESTATATARLCDVDDRMSLVGVLSRLYREQLAIETKNPYLVEHADARCIVNQARTFQWYAPHLPPRGAILEWGAQHGPDGCLLRAAFGDRFELFACDFVAPDRYRCFADFTRADYTQLHDLVRLPYGANAFDAVIASGVLEHTAMDYESLKELHRVLKPDGALVVSYLPNRLSVGEWYRRHVRRADFHRRLYGLAETKQLLKRAGFYPTVAGHHTFAWENLLYQFGRIESDLLSGILYRLLPLHPVCSTLALVARKALGM